MSNNIQKTKVRIVEIKNQISTYFTKGMICFYEKTSDRGDFRLTKINGFSQEFGFTYNSEHFVKD